MFRTVYKFIVVAIAGLAVAPFVAFEPAQGADTPTAQFWALYNDPTIQTVYADFREVADQGLSTIRLDSVNGQVDIGVVRGDSAVEDYFAQFGDLVSFHFAPLPIPLACSARDNCTPWRGATTTQETSGVDHATFTMEAQAATNPNKCFLVTAGHVGNHNSSPFYHHGVFIGTSTADTLESGYPHTVDARKVPMACSATTTKNTIYLSSATPADAITNVTPQNDLYINETADFAGQGSNFEGGYIADPGATGWTESVDGTLVTVCCDAFTYHPTSFRGGDSGAPVFSGDGHSLFGIMGVDLGSGNVGVSTAAGAQSELSIQFCISGVANTCS